MCDQESKFVGGVFCCDSISLADVQSQKRLRSAGDLVGVVKSVCNLKEMFRNSKETFSAAQNLLRRRKKEGGADSGSALGSNMIPYR